MSRRPLRAMLRSIRRLTPVPGQEDVLEVGLAHVERLHVETGERLEQRVDFAFEGETDDVAVLLDPLDPCDAGERIGRWRLGKGRFDVRERGAQVLDAVDEV